jgi:hypothetical protein
MEGLLEKCLKDRLLFHYTKWKHIFKSTVSFFVVGAFKEVIWPRCLGDHEVYFW